MRRACGSSSRALKSLPPGPVITDNHHVALPPKQKVFTEMEALIWHFKLIYEGSGCRQATPTPASRAPTASSLLHRGGRRAAPTGQGPAAVLRHLPGLPHLLEGHLVADFIAIQSSLNIIAGSSTMSKVPTVNVDRPPRPSGADYLVPIFKASPSPSATSCAICSTAGHRDHQVPEVKRQYSERCAASTS